MRKPGRSLMIVASLALGGPPSAALFAADKPKEEKVEGYAEWRRGDCLLVDGQRVCPDSQTEFKGEDGAVDFASIPLGYEVKARGVRRRRRGARWPASSRPSRTGWPCSRAMCSKATNAAEKRLPSGGPHVRAGRREQGVDLGVLHESGPMVDRVRRITRRLLPPYVDARAR